MALYWTQMSEVGQFAESSYIQNEMWGKVWGT